MDDNKTTTEFNKKELKTNELDQVTGGFYTQRQQIIHRGQYWEEAKHQPLQEDQPGTP